MKYFDNKLEEPNKWQKYFYKMADVASEQSLCLSTKIGAVIVRDKMIVSTGYNGPPRGVNPCEYRCPECGSYLSIINGMLRKNMSRNYQIDCMNCSKSFTINDIFKEPKVCPRKRLNYEHGAGYEICPAVHAETNAIVQAARLGVSTDGGTMYMTCSFPCERCAGAIINAGIKECYGVYPFSKDSAKDTIELTKVMFKASGVNIYLVDWEKIVS